MSTSEHRKRAVPQASEAVPEEEEDPIDVGAEEPEVEIITGVEGNPPYDPPIGVGGKPPYDPPIGVGGKPPYDPPIGVGGKPPYDPPIGVGGKPPYDPPDDGVVDGSAGAEQKGAQIEVAAKLPAVVGGRLPDTLNALNIYLARLKDVEILPIEEQSALADDFQTTGNPDAAARLVASNLRLVVKIAFQFRRQWADVMDLIAEGNVGLAEALRKFDVERGIPFPSYARFWIRARILAFIQENKHLIHAGSRAARKLFWRLERERRALINEGFDPSPKLLAERVGVKTSDVHELAPILDHRPLSLDTPIRGDEDGRSRSETIADERFGNPESHVGDGQVRDVVHEAFLAFRETLDERDQAIWDQRLQAEEPVRLDDLGGQFGISKERVRQLEVRIKQRLKKYIETHLGDEVIVEALR